MSAQAFGETLRRHVAARVSLVQIVSWEEERVEALIRDVAKRTFAQPVPLFTWSATDGLALDGQAVPDTFEPLAALQHALAQPGAALYLFRDLHPYLGDPRLVRKLRDVHHGLKGQFRTVFLVQPRIHVPPDLIKEMLVEQAPLPDEPELGRLFDQVRTQFQRVEDRLEAQDRLDLFRTAMGLTGDQARTAFTKLFLGRKAIDRTVIDAIVEEKRQLVRKSGVLEYVPTRVKLEDLGGLSNLKEWLKQRERFFSDEAARFGISAPKGLLLTGISGCGKSTCVQAIAAAWHLPMVRLDMNRVYAGVLGTPEETLEMAIRTAEEISPCVLWIDEIETALVGAEESDNLAKRLFSNFLTWMQEKPKEVFVAATANAIDRLPPELLRKGRFDEIFFVDLPVEAERGEIFAVHLRRRSQRVEDFDLVQLAKATKGFNGAEIEQVVVNGLFRAFEEGRPMVPHDLYVTLGRMVPLATTMSEQIKEIKRWADLRAVKASPAPRGAN
jgi:SpoVK/Ycf46/Vps4 family AAA+-type ATPase